LVTHSASNLVGSAISPKAAKNPITAQRIARFDHYRAHNCLPPQKLRREKQ
jgi:hypothetical protein